MAIMLYACGKKEQELSPAEINAKADSIVQSKMEKIRRQAKEDLDRRLPIEVKPKVDSIRKIDHTVGPIPVFPGDGVADSGGLDPVPPSKDSLKK